MQIKYRLVDTANDIGLGIFDTREQAQERVVEYCVQNVRLTIFDFKLVKVDLSEWQNIITFDDALEMLYLRNPNHPYRMAYLDMMGYNLKYCCPVKVNRKLCISLSIGIAAVLLIQRLGFQFQTVSIIECTYFDKKGPITTDNSKKL